MQHEIVFSRKGNECSTTRLSPFCSLAAFHARGLDLNATGQFILSHDDWRPVTEQLYRVATVELPDWLSPDEYCDRYIDFRYLWGMGVDQGWPESWQRGLLKLRGADQLACIKLLRTKKFRSEFRAKLRAQLEQWLDGHSEYAEPFSPRQWDCIVDRYVRRQASQISESIYRSR